MSSTRWLRRVPAVEPPLRAGLLSIGRVEDRARVLAAGLLLDPDPRRRPRDTFPRFEDNVRVLRGVYRTLADDVRVGRDVVPTADWLLDNFPLVTAEMSEIRRNLPRQYSRTLPALAPGEHGGQARIYVLAMELVRHSDSRLDRQQLLEFLRSYQRVAPLTIGELWAWPSMLKLVLIENLRRLHNWLEDFMRGTPPQEDRVHLSGSASQQASRAGGAETVVLPRREQPGTLIDPTSYPSEVDRELERRAGTFLQSPLVNPVPPRRIPKHRSSGPKQRGSRKLGEGD